MKLKISREEFERIIETNPEADLLVQSNRAFADIMQDLVPDLVLFQQGLEIHGFRQTAELAEEFRSLLTKVARSLDVEMSQAMAQHGILREFEAEDIGQSHDCSSCSSSCGQLN